MQKSVNQERWKFIGGSDVPIIMELSPFKSRFNLLLEKAQYKEDEFTGNVFTEYGNRMEGKIRDFINQNCIPIDCQPLTEGKHIKAIPKAWGNPMSKQMKIRAHTDGENDDCILEIKTTSQIHHELIDYRIYVVQLLFYMMITGKKRGLLAVYKRADDLSEEFDEKALQLFPLEIEEFTDECANIIKAISRFLEDLEKVKSNPFITEEELLPHDLTEISNRIIAFEQQLSMMKETEKKIKAEKERLKIAMETAGIPHIETSNGYKLTLIPDSPETVVKVSKFNEEKFKADHPDLHDEYTEIKNELKAGKKGYVRITAPKEATNG